MGIRSVEAWSVLRRGVGVEPAEQLLLDHVGEAPRLQDSPGLLVRLGPAGSDDVAALRQRQDAGLGVPGGLYLGAGLDVRDVVARGS